jgi:hypothetical protein
MKHLLFLSVLVPSIAFAEVVTVDKPVVCGSVELILTEISSKYKESAVWIGNKDRSRYALALNPETNTWSLIEYNDKIACLIDAGIGSQIRFPEQKK